MAVCLYICMYVCLNVCVSRLTFILHYGIYCLHGCLLCNQSRMVGHASQSYHSNIVCLDPPKVHPNVNNAVNLLIQYNVVKSKLGGPGNHFELSM